MAVAVNGLPALVVSPAAVLVVDLQIALPQRASLPT
jgi:hypothetical protein